MKQGTGIYAGFSDANPAAAALTASSSTFSSNGGTDTITVQLAAPAPAGGSTVILGFNGAAVTNDAGIALANLDYSISPNTAVTDPYSVTNLLGTPIELVIPQGQTTGSVVLTGLNNPNAIGDDNLNVSIVSINGTAPATPQSASLTLIDPRHPRSRSRTRPSSKPASQRAT